MSQDGSLSAQQEEFLREYLVDWNATRAAIAAGYSQRTAAQQGSRLLKSVKIRGRLAQLQARRRWAADRRKDLLIEYLMEIIDRDTSEAYEEEGAPKALAKIPLAIRRQLVGYERLVTVLESEVGKPGNGKDVNKSARARARAIKIRKIISGKIDWESRLQAMNLLARLDGHLKDKVEHDHRFSLEQLVAGAAPGPPGAAVEAPPASPASDLAGPPVEPSPS
jgi:phage terminase small subunit